MKARKLSRTLLFLHLPYLQELQGKLLEEQVRVYRGKGLGQLLRVGVSVWGEGWREERILEHPLGIQGDGVSRSCTVSCKPGACAQWVLRKVKQPVPLAGSAVRCGGLHELIGSGSPCGAAFPVTSTLISRFSILSSCEI